MLEHTLRTRAAKQQPCAALSASRRLLLMGLSRVCVGLPYPAELQVWCAGLQTAADSERVRVPHKCPLPRQIAPCIRLRMAS